MESIGDCDMSFLTAQSLEALFACHLDPGEGWSAEITLEDRMRDLAIMRAERFGLFGDNVTQEQRWGRPAVHVVATRASS